MLQTRRQVPRLLQSYQRSLLCRLNSTSAPESLSFQRSAEPAPVNEQVNHSRKAQDRSTTGPRFSAYVSTQPRLRSMVDVYAVVRAIERQYGAIREYAVYPAKDSPGGYRNKLSITFVSSASLQRLSAGTKALRIPAPEFDPSKPGGVSLHDLQQWLEPKDLEQSEQENVPVFDQIIKDAINQPEGSLPPPSIDISIVPSEQNIYAKGFDHAGNRPRPAPLLAQRFIAWGGFYQPNTQTGQSAEPDRPFMRAALEQARRFAPAESPDPVSSGTPQSAPAGPGPKDASVSQTEKPSEWDPLPVQVSEEPVPVPNAVEHTSDTEHHNADLLHVPSTAAPLSQVPPANPSSSSLPRRPTAKKADKLASSQLPSTRTSSAEAELLRQSTLTLPNPPTAEETMAKQKRKNEKENAKMPQTENAPGLSDRLKSFLGSWF